MFSEGFAQLCIKQKPIMNEWIIIMALAVAALATAAVGIVCSCCRRMERQKNADIVHAIHEQDRLARELERARIEKLTLERALHAKLSKAETDADPKQTP